jgi:hypothetical protein
MIETLISSKTRVKLLLKFFLNSRTTAYLRGLEGEFGESTNAIRVELNRFEDAGMLKSFSQGNKKIFQANTAHPLFKEVHNIVMKYIGVDHIIENVIERLGDVRAVYLAGEFARGINSDIIDLIFVGTIRKEFLLKLIEKVEPMIKRRVRYLIYESLEKFEESWNTREHQPFLIWSDDDKLLVKA